MEKIRNIAKELNQISCIKTLNQSSKEMFLYQGGNKINYNNQIPKL